MARVAEHLPGKLKALNSISSIIKKEKKKIYTCIYMYVCACQQDWCFMRLLSLAYGWLSSSCVLILSSIKKNFFFCWFFFFKIGCHCAAQASPELQILLP
jgi:hypothetical protein